MNKINEILDYGLLAEFAYLKLENERFKENNIYVGDYKGKPKNQISYKNKNDLINFLYPLDKKTNTLIGSEDERYNQTDIKPYRVEAMIDLLNRFKIIDFANDDNIISFSEGIGNSDFQAMLLQNISTSKYVIAFRGTAGITDILVDSQLANITSAHNFQLDEATEFINNMMKKHSFSKSDLTLTGHSLGGILSQYLGSHLKIKAFAFNALGTSTLEMGLKTSILYELLDRFGIVDTIDEDFINKNIITISYNDMGDLNGDILSNLATKLNASWHLGIKIDIFGSNVGTGDGHSIITLNQLLEKQSQNNLTTIDDIKNYNKTQKTLFFDLMIKEKISLIVTCPNDNKATLCIQSNSNTLEDLISDELITNISNKNIDLMINTKINEIEDKSTFHNKLYYNYEKNKLKVKTKDFAEASKIIKPFLSINDKLKKHDVIIQLQGEQ